MEVDDLGELCVSLCFRPISGRLIVTVTKIRGLPKATADRTGKLLRAPAEALFSKAKQDYNKSKTICAIRQLITPRSINGDKYKSTVYFD